MQRSEPKNKVQGRTTTFCQRENQSYPLPTIVGLVQIECGISARFRLSETLSRTQQIRRDAIAVALYFRCFLNIFWGLQYSVGDMSSESGALQ